MKETLVKLVVVAVGVSLTSVTIYTAITLSGEPKIYSYIPSDSCFISHFSYLNGSYYMFASDSSYAAITETPLWQIEGAVAVAKSNSSMNITITTAMSYHGYTIFEFRGIGLPEILSILGISGLNVSFPMPVQPVSIYLTQLTEQYSIMGTLTGIVKSIDTYLQKTGFSGFGTFVDENIPFSSTVFMHQNGITSRVSINITMVSTFITLYSSDPIKKPMILNLSNFFVGIQNISSQSVTFVIGVGWAEIQAVLGKVIDSISQNGGLDVKDYSGIPLLF